MMTTRDEVLEYFGWEVCVSGDQCCHDECQIPLQMADEIVRLRERLAAVEAERDRYKKQRDEMDRMWREDTEHASTTRNRAERILAALREPSEAVMKAAALHYSGDLRDAIRAAVAAAAAEQEVGP